MVGVLYTAVEEATIRAGYLRLDPLETIAASVGRSSATVRKKAKRMGLSNPVRKRRHLQSQMQQRHDEPGYTVALHAAAQSEGARAKRAETMRARWARPGYREAMLRRRRVAAALKRGYVVPADRQDEYDFLIGKKYTTRETGLMMKLLPADGALAR